MRDVSQVKECMYSIGELARPLVVLFDMLSCCQANPASKLSISCARSSKDVQVKGGHGPNSYSTSLYSPVLYRTVQTALSTLCTNGVCDCHPL